MRSTALDLTAAEVVADPYPYFAAERGCGAVAWHEPTASYLTFDHAARQRGAARPPARPDLDATGSRPSGSSRSTCCTATR